MAKKQPAKKVAQPDGTSTRQIDALNAQIDKLQGKKLSRQQVRDLAWLEHSDRTRHVNEWKEAVPKGEYCDLASRKQQKLINDAAERYDLPIGGPVINLREALTALHDLIAENARGIVNQDDADLSELKKEKMRQEILKLEKENIKNALDNQLASGEAIPKVKMQAALVLIATKLRGLGKTLERVDPEARDALNEFLSALAVEFESGELAF